MSKEKKEYKYKITLKVSGKETVVEGDDIEVLLASINVSNPKKNGELVVQNGKQVISEFLPLRDVRRFFSMGSSFTEKIVKGLLVKRILMKIK